MWRKKITYEKANAYGLTAGELAELEKAKEIKRGKARAATPEDIAEDKDEQGFLISNSPPSAARAGESQGGTTITVGLPPVCRRPPPVPPGPFSPPPRSPSPPGLPPSTAPPRLEQEQEEGRGKRKRVYIETYKLE